MRIQGSYDRVLHDAVPHEVLHTVFATHFRQPLPRWYDEGACTSVESPQEKLNYQKLLIHHLKTNRGIAFADMFAMTKYPRDVLPLYTQGWSLSEFLIAQRGRREFVAFGESGLRGGWVPAVMSHYGYQSLGHLQDSWLSWVRSGGELPSGIHVVGQPRRW